MGPRGVLVLGLLLLVGAKFVELHGARVAARVLGLTRLNLNRGAG